MASHPGVVQNVFQILEKLLKRKGDKHQVLVVAELAIEAARRSCRTDAEVRVEAHALICGRSWVYQRIERLDEARIWAQKSLDLGQRVGWDRNTAFCEKCIGRLLRMEAEQLDGGPERKKLLAESVTYLQDAIKHFGKLSEFGPSHSEVGECFSLLGRTHLTAARLARARECVARASRLLTDPVAKDYMDLSILKGDLLAAVGGEQAQADQYYEEALGAYQEGDAELSEVRARAFYKRGLNRAAGGQTGAAVHDLTQAKTIWRSLGEYKAAAIAAWNAIQLSRSLPLMLLRRLEREILTVRWRRIQTSTQEKGYSGSGEESPPSLIEPSSEACDQFVVEAGEWVAVNIVDW